MATNVFRRMFPAGSTAANPFRKTLWERVRQFKQEIFVLLASTSAFSLSVRLFNQREEMRALQRHNESMQEEVDRHRAAFDAIESLAAHRDDVEGLQSPLKEILLSLMSFPSEQKAKREQAAAER